jgi:hypothetical protein
MDLMRVRVEIARLVFTGVAPAARAAIPAKLERGLTRLLSDRATLESVVRSGRLGAATFSGLKLQGTRAGNVPRSRR